jgi:acetyltransferase-like isoleucine patch superfamily enzyme
MYATGSTVSWRRAMQERSEASFRDENVVVGYPAARVEAPSLRVGSGAHLRSGTVIYTGSRIGARLQTGHNVVIREQVRVGDDVSIWSNTVVDYGCVIGDRTKIHCNCYIAQFTEIGDDVFLAPGVIMANDLYPGRPASAEAMQGPRIFAGAQVGVNATILPYVTIGAGAIIGAGAVVTKDVPAGTVAYGNPATVGRHVDELGDIEERILRASAARGSGGFSPPLPDLPEG